MAFTKKDLKTGMICVSRSGRLSVYIDGTNSIDKEGCIVYSGTDRTGINKFDENTFEWFQEDKKRSEFVKSVDIVKIYKPDHLSQAFKIFTANVAEKSRLLENWKIVFEAKTKPEEMTLAEVCKALGKDIKIIKG